MNMKKILCFLVIVLGTISMYAQPLAFNYQASVRSVSGDVLVNTMVSIKISILSGTTLSNASSVYSERHSTNSGDYGIVSLQIGKGTKINGDINTIEWSTANKYIKVEMDVDNGTNYTDMGTSQLLSVPFALQSNTAKTANSINYKNVIDTPKIAKVALTGNYNDLTNKPVSPARYIGEQYGGGTIYWLDNTGAHGLIVANTDAAANVQFAAQDTIQVKYEYIDGKINTNIFKAAACGGVGINAMKTFNVGGYTDWYLPSANEMQLLINNLYNINSLINMFNNNSTIINYATSSTYSLLAKSIIVINNRGSFIEKSMSGTAYNVRLIRKF